MLSEFSASAQDGKVGSVGLSPTRAAETRASIYLENLEGGCLIGGQSEVSVDKV